MYNELYYSLADVAMNRFKTPRDVCIEKLKRAFQNHYAAIHMKEVRDMSRHN